MQAAVAHPIDAERPAEGYVCCSASIRQHLHELTALEQAVFHYLGNRINPEKKCWPSYTTIAREIGQPRSYVVHAVGRLERKRWIAIERRRLGACWTTNIYTVLRFYFWARGGGQSCASTPATASASDHLYEGEPSASPEAEGPNPKNNQGRGKEIRGTVPAPPRVLSSGYEPHPITEGRGQSYETDQEAEWESELRKAANRELGHQARALLKEIERRQGYPSPDWDREFPWACRALRQGYTEDDFLTLWEHKMVDRRWQGHHLWARYIYEDLGAWIHNPPRPDDSWGKAVNEPDDW